MNDLEKAIAQAKAEITDDVKTGRVPRNVTSFGDLHDHVDANEYGGLCDERGDFDIDFANALQNAVDEWIKNGGLAGPNPAGARLVVTYDVSGLTRREVDTLHGAALAQSERMKDDGYGGYPDVPVTSEVIGMPDPEPPRVFAVTVMVEVPADAPCNANDVSDEIKGAISVGTDIDMTPALVVGTVSVAQVEEV